MAKFELLVISEDGRRAVPNPLIMGVKEFDRLVARDRTGSKSIAAAEFAYIYHVCDPLSPYSQYEIEFRKEKLKRDFLPKDWVEDVNVELAIEKFKELRHTSISRLLEGALAAIHNLTHFFRTVDLSEEDAMGKPKWRPSDLMMPLKDLDKVSTSVAELTKKVQEEDKTVDRTRGAIELNSFNQD